MSRSALIVTVLLLASVAVSYAKITAALRSEFGEFVAKQAKTYTSPEEFTYRMSVYANNLQRIEKLNAEDDGATYAMNHFGDLTADEFKNLYLSKVVPDLSIYPQSADLDVSAAPESVDWRKEGAVTSVKNQGQCGSCWSFSTTGNVEAQWFFKTGKLVSLSEQQLVDCDTKDQGCNGGLMTNAFEYIIKNGGLEAESSYPYTAKDGKCKFNKASVVATIKNYTTISSDEAQMAAACAQYGPLSIGINAENMQFYSSGIANPKSCNPAGLDHGVLIVGYGVENGVSYWIIKNSWGPGWGEAGYYRIVRGVGKCGVNKMVSTAHHA